MKRAILAIAVLALAFACKKDKEEAKFCYTCTVSMVTDGVDMGATSTVEQCNLTEAQKDQFEKSGTVENKITSGGETIVQKVTTKCTRK